MILDQLLQKLANNQALITALSAILIAMSGFIISLFNRLKSSQDLKAEAEKESLKSIKRSALRNEYLNIYNSPYFTQEQKIGLTRDIIKDYKALNGNHYIHTLDKELQEGVVCEVDK